VYTRYIPAVAPAWGGPVTISNCGGSDADNVCGAGTMTKAEAEGWNNRVWDDRPCCWDCECTAVRWKANSEQYLFCGFSAWSAAGETNKDGDHAMGDYMLQVAGLNIRAGNGGEGPPIAGWASGEWAFAADVAGKFLEVHLTQTGADLVINGVTIHSIASAPADSQYRFGCATQFGNGYTELAYHGLHAAPLTAFAPLVCRASCSAVCSGYPVSSATAHRSPSVVFRYGRRSRRSPARSSCARSTRRAA
jgi:hypothetical protein